MSATSVLSPNYASLPEGVLEVRLPEAPPEAYLQWADWLLEVNYALETHPALQAAADTEQWGGLRPRGWVGEYISEVFLPAVAEQALQAKMCGRDGVSPRLTRRVRLLSRVVLAMQEQARALALWLEDEVAARAVGLACPGWQIELLRSSAFDAIRRQLGSMPDRIELPPSEETRSWDGSQSVRSLAREGAREHSH